MNYKVFCKTILMILCCLVTLAFTSCDDDADKQNAYQLKFTPTNIETLINRGIRVTMTNGVAPYTIATNNPRVASFTMDKNTIVVMGVSSGSAVVTVTDTNNASGKFIVSVKDPAFNLELDKCDLALEVGDEDIVTIIGGSIPFSVKVKDESVASASLKDDKVTVKGLRSGNTILTINDRNGKYGTVNIQVK